MTVVSGKAIDRIRREPIDRMFVGTHDQKIENREKWYEMTHLIKGATIAFRQVVEKNGDGGNQAASGYMIEITAEPAQNTFDDYDFYQSVCNGLRNVAIVTGKETKKGDKVLIRLFRLIYLGAGQWGDSRIYLVTDEAYNNSMDKASLASTGWVPFFERYTATGITLLKNKLNFTILQGFVPAISTSGGTNR